MLSKSQRKGLNLIKYLTIDILIGMYMGIDEMVASGVARRGAYFEFYLTTYIGWRDESLEVPRWSNC
jgi:hypothetical protein